MLRKKTGLWSTNRKTCIFPISQNILLMSSECSCHGSPFPGEGKAVPAHAQEYFLKTLLCPAKFHPSEQPKLFTWNDMFILPKHLKVILTVH
jgi:hypothetical protein